VVAWSRSPSHPPPSDEPWRSSERSIYEVGVYAVHPTKRMMPARTRIFLEELAEVAAALR
jgi:hypothetical protein